VSARLSRVDRDDTHRLTPSRWADQSVLARISDGPEQLDALFELEGATNDRLLGAAGLLAGISVHELLFGVAHAHIVNAAFCHAPPGGGRFNGADRGAWYAAFDLDTARAEVAFHKDRELREIGWSEPETFEFADYLADFHGDFHDIRRDPRYADCLAPDQYDASQRLAAELLGAGSGGLIYPSVRHRRGTCLVCFRPALVTNVRNARTVAIRWRP
jgi:RES domain-containing protein